MDDTQQILEQVKKLLATTPAPDQAKSLEAVQSWSASFPPSTNVASAQPFITDARQLTDPAIYKQFEDLGREFIVTDNEEEAMNARRLLEDMLLPQNKGLRTQRPDMYEKYQKILVLLKFVCLPSRSLNEIDFLIREFAALAVKSGINVQEKMDAVLFANDDVLNDGQIAFRLSRDMLSSKEEIGDAVIYIHGENKEARPSLGSWLKDYLSSSIIGQSNGRSAFQRVSYMKQNKNILKLNQTDRDVLFELIKIYDWLEFGDYESQNEQGQSWSKNDYIKSERFTIPESIYEEPEIRRSAPVAGLVKSPPAVPAPGNGPVAKKVSMSEILSGVDNQPEDFSKPVPTKPKIEDFKAKPSAGVILPEYDKAIPPAKITAETLAAKMAANKNLESRIQNQGQQQSKPKDNLSVPRQARDISPSTLLRQGSGGQVGENNNVGSASKAEQYLQREIDQKLHNLDDRVHKKQE